MLCVYDIKVQGRREGKVEFYPYAENNKAGKKKRETRKHAIFFSYASFFPTIHIYIDLFIYLLLLLLLPWGGGMGIFDL